MRRAITLALATAAVSGSAAIAQAQVGMGQAAMAPAGGVVNRAVGAFQNLNQNGPGWLYYGINAADRGLGYNGSYMTLGGFIPYAEDDLGGFWAADLRGHLSEYGGFFSNVGFVRKQFLGGTLLGVGVYWDYDGDQNQYITGGRPGTSQFGQFGHTYQQVGVSGEWLTDFGNIRSNGYIPVGSTAYTVGNPGSPFYQNFVMCQNGLDAALSGVDLEVGAYIPGLSDWAGMISVGGYALGNARYNWNQGPLAGKDVVPWFGGVYTRLDMTFIENWDFSLQANNDSYFDWTGFARLTYRMGGSRRRNVPDQMEQPMMRNEHIVRAHQTPEVAINPSTGTPWRVIHVNNAAAAGGNGTVEAPFNTLAAGDTAATNPWDIVFVSRGTGTAVGYSTEFSFNQQNQYLVGDGASFFIPTVTCGLKDIATNTTGQLPLLSNPAGNSVLINGAVGGNATIANLQINGSDIGIAATGNLGASSVSNVTMAADGTKAGQSGVEITNATGAIAFTDTSISNMTRNGLLVDGGGPTVTYQGSISNATAGNGPVVEVRDTTNAIVSIAVGSAPGSSTVPNKVVDNGGQGVVISNNGAGTKIDIDNVSLTNNAVAAISVLDDDSATSITAGSGSGIQKTTTGAAITVEGGAPTFDYYGPITNARPSSNASPSFLLNVSDTSGGSVTVTSPPGAPFQDTGDGIQIVQTANTDVTVSGAKITSAGGQGILVNNNSGGAFTFNNVTIDGATTAGVLATDSPLSSLAFANLNISLSGTAAVGFQADNVGPITTTDANAISVGSQPAVVINDSGALAMTFRTVSTKVTSGSNNAMLFTGSTNGTFDVTSVFSVSGSPGTVAADVTGDNPPTMTVTVPPTP